jgi:ubiquinone/menaquinone biosynthesis C-methylase UbiE
LVLLAPYYIGRAKILQRKWNLLIFKDRKFLGNTGIFYDKIDLFSRCVIIVKTFKVTIFLNKVMIKNFRQKKEIKGKDTSWGKVAFWYDELLENKENTYQKELILPNLLRLMEIKRGEKILDLACGQGFFTREFSKAGAESFGTDISGELIEIARKNSPENIKYYVSPADKLVSILDESMDKVVIVLAIQNIDNFIGTVSECFRVLKKGGKLYIVLNHPAFRIPKKSDWGFDEKTKTQYRIIYQYLSELLVNINMHPSKKLSEDESTVSFHRPLQSYFKAFFKNGFAVSRLEEWSSHKKSQSGPRQKAEDRARKEIPLFMCIEAVKG